jgi:diadenosine tetraphosphate (Ap4A) HIT family hydrolase
VAEIGCVFCRAPSHRILTENALAFAIRNKAPVRPLHTLIISRRHVSDIFETTASEREVIHELAVFCRKAICTEDPDVGGFNFGSNIGRVAGQKVMHAHVHLIPRRSDDPDLPAARPEGAGL